ncbi:zinc-ribbon domain-containing protein [Halorubrum sp. DTA98]|uniref:zinc-ribbon domain-containing protein n=1 Tax=Halorubrum sp. DTA98 TaxID=3402163 RepID=UPI003AAD287D
MKSCPRCEASIDESARFCVECGAPQTEAAAEELDEYVQEQAETVVAESGMSDGQNDGGDGNGDGGSNVFSAAAEELSDREQLWRRGCYAAGYGTVVVALTMVPAIEAWFLLLGGIAILPPIRRLTAEPLGSPLKREVMAGLYGVFVLIGIVLFAVL